MADRQEENGFQFEDVIDTSSISIDESASREFLNKKQGEERGSNVLRIGKDSKGNDLLLKTSIFLQDNQKNLMTTEELKNKFPSMNISMPFDAFLGRIEEKLKGESTASNLGRHLGVPMAESHFVSVNETKCDSAIGTHKCLPRFEAVDSPFSFSSILPKNASNGIEIFIEGNLFFNSSVVIKFFWLS